MRPGEFPACLHRQILRMIPLAAISIGLAPLPANSATRTSRPPQQSAMPSLLDSHARRSHIVMMEVTAYCPCEICCGPHAHGITASGHRISYNGGAFVAADADLFDFGTRVRIPGYKGGKPVPVMDRGGAIVGNHLDVFFPTHQQALKWGHQWLPVTVLDQVNR